MYIQPQFEYLKEEILRFINNFNTQGENVTTGERNSIKKFITKDGVILNVKSFKVPNTLNGFVYKYIRESKAKRSFEYAKRLIKNDILTPFPVAYSEEDSLIGLQSSYYVSMHLDYDFDFRDLIHKPKFVNRDLILEQFTEFTFKLHENNINFLDHSPGNTLIVNKGVGCYDFYLIDLNRMRFEVMDFNKRMNNFRRLWPSKTMIKIMAKRYAELYNKTYEEVHVLMLKSSLDFQRSKNAKKLRRLGRVLKFSNS